jgi:hypothetical protein
MRNCENVSTRVRIIDLVRGIIDLIRGWEKVFESALYRGKRPKKKASKAHFGIFYRPDKLPVKTVLIDCRSCVALLNQVKVRSSLIEVREPFNSIHVSNLAGTSETIGRLASYAAVRRKP